MNYIKDNAYTLLGVSKSDSNDVIDRKYKKLLVKYHPDKAKNNSDRKLYLKMFTLVNSAYEYIMSTRVETCDIQKGFITTPHDNDINTTHFDTHTSIETFNNHKNEQFNRTYNDILSNKTKHASSESDYSKFDNNVFNPFTTSNTSSEEFNKTFEYIKKQNQPQKQHSTDICPYMQNSSVAICNNKFMNYSDAFSKIKNPNSIIDTSTIPEREQITPLSQNDMDLKMNAYNNSYTHVNNVYNNASRTPFFNSDLKFN